MLSICAFEAKGEKHLFLPYYGFIFITKRTVLLFIPPIRERITETRGKTRGLLYVHNCFELFCHYVHAL